MLPLYSWILNQNYKNIFSDCNCNQAGSENDVCDGNTGECSCKTGFTGNKCDKCYPGYFGFPNCISKYLLFSIYICIDLLSLIF